MKIVFMGTPDFAVPSLDILVKNGYDVVGVVTATDKLGGRGGKQLLTSAVKQYAETAGLRILQPEKLKNPDWVAELRNLEADLFIVVAFRMLPEIVWTMPPMGTFNLHGSLLPKYRGAAPINWAVINGETETGVTSFFLKHEIDTGDLMFQEKITIGEDETAGELHDRLMVVAAETVLKTVQAIDNQQVDPQPQLDTEATHAPKIFHETCQIDWSKSAAEVHNFVRGLSPYPTAWTTFQGQKLKVFRTKKEILSEAESLISQSHNLQSENPPPQYVIENFETDGKSYLKIPVKDGFIQLLDVQIETRKRMSIRDFLNGHKF
jgi:methionyl-tRNA formyltransferase